MKLQESQTSADDASNNVDNVDLFDLDDLVSCRQVDKRRGEEENATEPDVS